MIPGYSINESLKRDDDRHLIRGVRAEDNLPVLIREIPSKSSEPHLAKQLESEFSTLRGINIPGVLKAHELVVGSDSIALVLEDPGGTLLDELLASGPLDLPDFLTTLCMRTMRQICPTSSENLTSSSLPFLF